MFNIGAGEMVFILIAALLILGPQRLPELARGIGRFLREFRRQTDEVRTVVVREFYQMDQEVQREPSATPASPAPPPATPAAPELAPPEHSALPLPPALSMSMEPAAQDHSPPAAPTPGEVAQAGAQAPAVAPTGTAGEGGSEQEEPLPRFDPIPGTVARNAPKQS